MCGIAGSLGRPSAVAALVRGLRHRGPDAAGLVRAGELAIGAARLRVNGGAEGDMPLRSASGRTLVAVNGEIFNHREVFGTAAGGSDLAGIADLLENEGPAALRRLRGPFALAAADLRDGSLLLARDEIGVRPLFVREAGDSVLAASEIAPLLAESGGPERDDAAWDFLVATHFWPADRTPWAGLAQVRPGTWRRYRRAPGGIEASSGTWAFAGGEEDLAPALDEAFRLQAPCPLKCAILLSGGLDSSAVLALLARAGRTPDLAAVGWFPGAGAAFDERPMARAVARECGVPLLEVPIAPEAFAAAWPEVTRALGGPLAGPGAASQWILARALAGEGVRVVYSGQGGDELFGGYERHRVLQQADLGQAPDPAPGYEGLRPPDGRDLAGHLLFRGAELLPHLDPGRRAAVAAAARSIPGPGPGRADRVLSWECGVLLPGLLAVDDRTAAAFGMEGRVPLLDPVLARLARRIPLREKSPPAAPRKLFRDLLGARLPEAARARRDKMGFPVPLDAWFRAPLRAWILDRLADPALREIGFLAGLADAAAAGRISARNLWFLGSAAVALAGAGPRCAAAPAAAALQAGAG